MEKLFNRMFIMKKHYISFSIFWAISFEALSSFFFSFFPSSLGFGFKLRILIIGIDSEQFICFLIYIFCTISTICICRSSHLVVFTICSDFVVMKSWKLFILFPFFRYKLQAIFWFCVAGILSSSKAADKLIYFFAWKINNCLREVINKLEKRK